MNGYGSKNIKTCFFSPAGTTKSIGDLRKARSVGKTVVDFFTRGGTVSDAGMMKISNSKPYKAIPSIPKIAPTTDDSKCVQCGKCVESCPSDAISMDNTIKTNNDTCIWCNACVKNCPSKARINIPIIDTIAKKFSHDLLAYKEPEIFLLMNNQS